jgi:hypothetical protein
MRLTLVEAGLRPIIALEHSLVVDGRKQEYSRSPLGVMVHQGKPILVSIDVTGRRVATAIDGQEVDLWTDATSASGGAAFFAKDGERSRLYWMRFALNQDFLGRVCALIDPRNDAVDAITTWLPIAPSGASVPLNRGIK